MKAGNIYNMVDRLIFLLEYLEFHTSLQVIHDVNDLVSEVCGDYLGHISRHLSSCSTEVLDVVRTSMLQGGDKLKEVLPLLTNTIIEIIVDKSVEVKP